MLYLSHRENNVTVLGPGRRYVIWLQGCKKHCPGCLYPQGREIGKNGYWMKEQDLFQEIQQYSFLTGVTVSGGEPFLQPSGLANLVRLIKESSHLDIMLYSGYTLEELRSWGDSGVDYILDHSDILVDGEYVENLNTNHIYRGSDNQRIHFLSNKYKPFREIIENTYNRSLEFVVKGEELFVVGVPAKGFERKWQNDLVKKREENKNERKKEI